MRLARGLVDEVAGRRDPVVLEVAPLARDRVGEDLVRVIVAVDEARRRWTSGRRTSCSARPRSTRAACRRSRSAGRTSAGRRSRCPACTSPGARPARKTFSIGLRSRQNSVCAASAMASSWVGAEPVSDGESAASLSHVSREFGGARTPPRPVREPAARDGARGATGVAPRRARRTDRNGARRVAIGPEGPSGPAGGPPDVRRATPGCGIPHAAGHARAGSPANSLSGIAPAPGPPRLGPFDHAGPVQRRKPAARSLPRKAAPMSPLTRRPPHGRLRTMPRCVHVRVAPSSRSASCWRSAARRASRLADIVAPANAGHLTAVGPAAASPGELRRAQALPPPPRP